VPVLFMMDESVGHMTERVVIPPYRELTIVPRNFTTRAPGAYKPYEPEDGSLVPAMTKAGMGHNVHITGLTHDARGYPVMNANAQDKLIRRLVGKIRDNVPQITDVRTDGVEGADVVVLSYGITSRIAMRAVRMARQQGRKVGYLRLVTVWPFPEQIVRELAERVKALVMPEINMGQIVLEVERCAAGKCRVVSVPHAGGTVHDPRTICHAIMEATG